METNAGCRSRSMEHKYEQIPSAYYSTVVSGDSLRKRKEKVWGGARMISSERKRHLENRQRHDCTFVQIPVMLPPPDGVGSFLSKSLFVCLRVLRDRLGVAYSPDFLFLIEHFFLVEAMVSATVFLAKPEAVFLSKVPGCCTLCIDDSHRRCHRRVFCRTTALPDSLEVVYTP